MYSDKPSGELQPDSIFTYDEDFQMYEIYLFVSALSSNGII